MSVTTEKELADAVSRNEDTIVIEGDLAKKLFESRRQELLHGLLLLALSASSFMG